MGFLFFWLLKIVLPQIALLPISLLAFGIYNFKKILHFWKYSFLKELNIYTTKVPYLYYSSIYNSCTLTNTEHYHEKQILKLNSLKRYPLLIYISLFTYKIVLFADFCISFLVNCLFIISAHFCIMLLVFHLPIYNNSVKLIMLLFLPSKFCLHCVFPHTQIKKLFYLRGRIKANLVSLLLACMPINTLFQNIFKNAFMILFFIFSLKIEVI